MKRLFIIIPAILVLSVGYSFAHMQRGMIGQGMMGSQSQQQTGETPQTVFYYPCPHMMGYGMMGSGMMMGPGIKGYGMMEPGMMMGPGMMGPGMMGHHGMMGPGVMGPGMMGYGMRPGMWGYSAETYQKFLNETADLRKELHNKRFEYFEALRNPDTKPETITGIEKEIQGLQSKIYEKAPR